MRRADSSWRVWFLVGLAMALASPDALAASIANTAWSKGCLSSPPSCVLEVYFDTGLKEEDRAASEDVGNYALIEFGTPQEVVPVTKASQVQGTFVYVELTLGSFSPKSDVPYLLIVRGLTFKGEPIEAPLVHTLGSITGKPGYSMEASDSREESSVYFAGEITGARGTGPFFSVDAKVERPREYTWWRKLHSVGPFFDLRAGSSPDADPDSMKFGYSWRFNVVRFAGQNDPREYARSEKGHLVPNLWWTNGGKIEAERDFDAANLVWESKLELPITPPHGTGRLFRLTPFAGVELGRSLKSPLRAFEGQSLARLYAGSRLFARFGSPARVFLEASYIRRWPLKDELVLMEDEDNMVFFIQSFGQGPREYVDAKLKFVINKFFGAYAGYEYGELPPSYKLVDHRFRLGVVYQFAWTPPE